jgi:hypothetical protein
VVDADVLHLVQVGEDVAGEHHAATHGTVESGQNALHGPRDGDCTVEIRSSESKLK